MDNNENNKFSLEILHDYKELSIQMSKIAKIILIFWILTIAGFLYYLSLYDYGNTSTQDVNNTNNSNIEQSVK